MSAFIRKPKDFIAGLVYACLGVAAILLARDYDLGSPAHMGPAYFPTAIGICLTMLGIASVVRSLLMDGERVASVSWRPLILISLSVVVFAYLLPRVGLVPSLVILLVIAAVASREMRFSFTGIVEGAALIAFCALVFVKVLGLPLPLIGPWMGA